MSKRKNIKGFTIVEALLALIFVALIALIGLYVAHNHKSSSSNNASNTTSANTSKSSSTAKSTDPYAGWKTYTSTTEKANFKYPANWVATKAGSWAVDSSPAIADSIGIKSPSGKILVSWVSPVGGVGGFCDDTVSLGSSGGDSGPPCPKIDVVSKTSIVGASGLYVVAGSVTSDGTTYQPWLTVQDSTSGVLKSGRGLPMTLFSGRNKEDTNVSFAVDGTGAGWSSSTYSSPTQVQAILNGAEAQQAKLILLSLTY